MICLTGDVHHSMGSPEQNFIDVPESKLAETYVKIAHKYDIKTTLFVTGKTFEEKGLGNWIKSDGVEIGGHTWSAFRPQWLHRIFRVVTGSIYGPKFYQKRDVQKTVSIIEEYTGQRPISWRTHAYASDQTTQAILEEVGIKIFSDQITPSRLNPWKLSNRNLISLPINVMPDHEHLYHGDRSKEHVQKEIEKGWEDSFTSKSFNIEKYFEIIKSQIDKIERNGGTATLLLHPICMKVADNFETFEKLCQWISEKNYDTILCREAVDYVDEE